MRSRSPDAQLDAGLAAEHARSLPSRRISVLRPLAPGAAAARAVRLRAPALRQHRHAASGTHLVLAHEAVAAGKRAGAAAAAPQRVLGDAHRQVVLDRLDRRVARVAHVRVHAADARAGRSARPCRRPSSRSTRTAAPCAGRRRRASRCSSCPGSRRESRSGQRLRQRAEHDVGDALRRLDVAAGDRRRHARVDDACPRARSPSSGRDDAGVVQHVVVDEAAERVERRRQRDREVRVDAAVGLRIATR